MELLSRVARITETMPDGGHVSLPMGWLREQLEVQLGAGEILSTAVPFP